MKFIELAKKRYSVRKYTDKKVEDEKINAMLEVANVAPTACNNQPQRIIVVSKEDNLAKINKGSRTFGAPLALIVCADHQESWKRPYDNMDSASIDASIITSHMMLQATDLGLDSVWVCHFNRIVIKEEFSIPENIEPINILLVGYAQNRIECSNRHTKERKSIEDTVIYEGF